MLWKIDIQLESSEIVVRADNIEDAERIARWEADSYVRDTGLGITTLCPSELEDVEHIPWGWTDSIPFGDDTDGRTCEQILALTPEQEIEKQAAAFAAQHQLPLPGVT